jgi:hypothetical protein
MQDFEGKIQKPNLCNVVGEYYSLSENVYSVLLEFSFDYFDKWKC